LRVLSTLVLLSLCLGCAGDLVLRAPSAFAPRTGSALSTLPPLAIEVPPGVGGGTSADAVGERAAGVGRRGGALFLTEAPAAVLRRLVVGELEQAGHRVLDERTDVTVQVRVMEFSLDDVADSPGWLMVATVRMALRISDQRDSEDFTELLYTSERSSETLAWPGVASNERVLAECLADLAKALAEEPDLARALQHHAGAGR
jgi:hypothetical protein